MINAIRNILLFGAPLPVVFVPWQNNGTWSATDVPFSNTPSLGSELFLTPDFASDTNWTKGAGWTIASGVATHASGGGANSITQAVSVSGTWYSMVWTVSASTGAGTLQAQFGTISQLSPSHISVGTYTDINLATGTLAGVRPGNLAACDVDAASLKALTLNQLFNVRPGISLPASVAGAGTIASSQPAGVVYGLDSITTPTNCILATHDGTNNIVLRKLVAGAWTAVLATTATLVAGQLPEVRWMSANTFGLYYNGTQRGANQTISDAGTGLLHGAFSVSANSTITGITVT